MCAPGENPQFPNPGLLITCAYLFGKIGRDAYLCFLIKIRIHFATSMARRDDITGVKPLNGFNSSKANNKTKRKFYPNLQKRKFYLPEEDRWVTLKVTAKTLRTINKNGIAATLNKARAAGTLKKDI